MRISTKLKFMKKFIYTTIIFITVFSFQVLLAQAQVDMNKQLEVAGETSGPYAAGTDEYTMSEIAGTAVSAFLSILGLIFIILTIYGGYTYMMARGNEEQIEKALHTIRRAIIGLIITVGAYAIWSFIFSEFL